MVTGFQIDVQGGTPGVDAGIFKGLDLSVGLPGRVMVSASDDFTIFNDHCADHGVR
jgi:hypothetical protein